MGVRTFTVARNPDPESSLPYLVRLPMPDGTTLVLRAREPWPRKGQVYCHDSGDQWPDDPDVVDDVAVSSVQKRGVGVNVILDRRQLRRCQFVFTTAKGGRPMIMWQSPTTGRRGPAASKLPRRRASELSTFTILRDSREQLGWTFSKYQATVERDTLVVGDYAVRNAAGHLIAAVERKNLDDYRSSISTGAINHVMAELAALPRAAVVIEGHYSDLFKVPEQAQNKVQPSWIPELTARLQVLSPTVPIVFAGGRAHAEQWTYRWLGAALVELADHVPDNPVDDRTPGDIVTLYEGGRWKNRVHGKKRATSTHDTHDEAIETGARLAVERGVAHHR